jgi:hypothetical protein
LDDLPADLSESKRKQVQMCVLSKCLEKLLRTARQASFNGKWIKDPWGRRIMVVPRLLAYVADQPEYNDIAGIRGHSSNQPCEICEACMVMI